MAMALAMAITHGPAQGWVCDQVDAFCEGWNITKLNCFPRSRRRETLDTLIDFNLRPPLTFALIDVTCRGGRKHLKTETRHKQTMQSLTSM